MSDYTLLYSEAAHDFVHMKSLGLDSNIKTASMDKLFFYARGLKSYDASKPILVLIHGYPQSWRHIIPLLPAKVPLFIPDIPGYGRSAPLTTTHSKINTGLSILSHLHHILPQNPSHPIILAGHDRGAHIAHRLTVSNLHPSFQILGTVLLDITPTLSRWSSFANPSTAIGGFHWPFLANVSLATSMINAFGGDQWAKICLERWSGTSSSALARFKDHDAWDVYMRDFKRTSVVEATCDDYRAGAEEDAELQAEDQEMGRKMDCPVLKVYSELFLGEKYDMRTVWGEFMGKGELELVGVGVGGGVGHFVAEEAPEETADAIVKFYKRITLTEV